MSFRLGLTGSMGMGKSTTAGVFAEAGCAVWDADAAVHRLYAEHGAAVAPLREVFPQAIENNQVSRDRLKAILASDPEALKVIERIVHPLVAQDREAFASSSPQDILVFDIPLLFETGGDAKMDAVVVVSIDAETQMQRILARGTMTRSQIEQILAKQMPDAQKRQRADYLVITDTLDHTKQQVSEIISQIREKLHA